MEVASDRPGDYTTRGALPSSRIGLYGDEGETTELVGVDGPRLIWRVRVWFALGRHGRYHDYCMWTHSLHPHGHRSARGSPRRRRPRGPTTSMRPEGSVRVHMQ